jgi:hypothetical protein
MKTPLDTALLVKLYLEQPLSVDKLPYTKEINVIVDLYNQRHISQPIDHRTAYLSLMSLRKNSKLIRKSDKRFQPS